MIISVEKLKSNDLFKDLDDFDLKDKLESLESLIRSYTNNNFQNRNVRFVCSSLNDRLECYSPYLKVGDTIQISQSKVNDGLFVIEDIDDFGMTLDKDIFDNEENTITLIQYPKAIEQVVINILTWEKQFSNKMGIQSESIGRHSVTYFNQNDTNSLGGYPLSLFNPLNSFKKARF